MNIDELSNTLDQLRQAQCWKLRDQGEQGPWLCGAGSAVGGSSQLEKQWEDALRACQGAKPEHEEGAVQIHLHL
ncbi:hypothetical protein P7K49_025233, partial [Saguinus oedipus]